ncbi:MAG: glycosyl transferase family 25 [Cocleimonas sp.]|jgi:glycosyl transferase family 25
MKALVINVDSANKRMEFQKQQLNSLAIDFQRLPAFKIDNSDTPIYQQYYETWQRPMSLSEVSCFFSHKTAWEQIIKENQAMLVLEDDALLAQNIPCILKELSTLKNSGYEIDYANLEERKNRKKLLSKKSTTEFCDVFLTRLYQGRSGAAGYVLWPSGAKKLLQQMNNKGIGIADKFINENYSLKSYQIEPASIIQLDQCQFHGIKSPFKVSSSINPRTTSSKPKQKWKFRLRRFAGELKIAINQLQHLHHASRRTTKITEYFQHMKKRN